MKKTIQLVDTTIRDGGLGLEDAEKNNLSTFCFSSSILQHMIDCLQRSNIDIIELGAIERTNQDMRRFAIFQDIQSISKMIPSGRSMEQMYVALYRGPDTPIQNIPRWEPTLCEGVRVILRYSELQKSLDFCSTLAEKGYKVFVQPMLTMRYTDEELQQIICASNEMGAYALYFVDSYGYMQGEDVETLFQTFDTALHPSIKIGFHPHNNMNLAFANAKRFLAQKTSRARILDSCALGLGQGAGNLQTEIITDHLNQRCQHTYDYDAVLELCEIIDHYWTNNIWGYSIIHFLPARHRAAYKYAVAMRHHYHLSLIRIDHILNAMPEKLRQRYTPQDLEYVLKMCGELKCGQ